MRDDVFGPVTRRIYSLIGDDTGAAVTNVGGTAWSGPAAADRSAAWARWPTTAAARETHALLAGSPAIDSGHSGIASPPENDQRGAPFVRIFDGDGAGGARIDIGAYERQTVAGLNLVVDTAVDEHDGDYSAGDLSLREAIDLANGSVGRRHDHVRRRAFRATITLGGTELAISEALVIDARPLAANVTIDANELSRIFNITATTGDFTLGGLTLTGGRTTDNNPEHQTLQWRRDPLAHHGDLTLDQSTVSGNSTAGMTPAAAGFGPAARDAHQSTVSGNSTAEITAQRRRDLVPMAP